MSAEDTIDEEALVGDRLLAVWVLAAVLASPDITERQDIVDVVSKVAAHMPVAAEAHRHATAVGVFDIEVGNMSAQLSPLEPPGAGVWIRWTDRGEPELPVERSHGVESES